jgi:hypothetical protein
MRIVLFLVPLVLGIYCLVDAITSRDDEVRHLQKTWWVLLILFFPFVGSIAWLVAGRPQRGPRHHGPHQQSANAFPEYDRPGRFAAADPAADEEFLRKVRERAESQRRATPPKPEQAPPEVVIDEGVLDAESESFLVSSAAPESAVVAAIRRANDRFMLVDELGREHADGAALDAASEAHDGEDLYTPNYTADPVVTDAGVRGYVDCKGGIEPAMGETMRRILREELRKLGATVHVREHDGT